jgi:serine/threonine-protein kinase
MDPARWERIQALFHDAADLLPDEQRSFLESTCEGDARLVTEVLAMLEEDARGASLLDRDMAGVAGVLVGASRPDVFDARQFHPYVLQAPLGEGGMGVVYSAVRPDLGSRVAIKILRDGWLSPARRRRFVAEQRTLAQLNHPGIARLYDAQTLAEVRTTYLGDRGTHAVRRWRRRQSERLVMASFFGMQQGEPVLEYPAKVFSDVWFLDFV